MTYEYLCSECQHVWEEEQSISAPPTEKCPHCGKLAAKRQVSGGVGFILKGGGWYADGYGSGSSAKKSDDGSSSSSSGGGGKSSSTDTSKSTSTSTSTKTDTSSTDSKPSGSAKSGDSPASPPA